MTVNELIEMLKTYPGDMRVLTLGYEGGLDDVDVKWDNVVFNTNNDDTWYIGKHDYARRVGDEDDQSTECVIIGRAK